jgi:sugar lactone lactonase YvrE
MPQGGGTATLVVDRQVTNAQESPDGQWLYFADWLAAKALWRMRVAGGDVDRVVERMSDAAGYAPTNQGVYYWAQNGLRQELRFINLPSRENKLYFSPRPRLLQISQSRRMDAIFAFR